MKINIGCDIVHIPKFIESVDHGGQEFLDKIFTQYEQAQAQSYESLAGVFASKEAFLKASGLKFDSWHAMEVYKFPSGKPAIRVTEQEEKFSCDISISHDGDYAFACVVWYRE